MGVVRLEVGTTKNCEGRAFPFAVLPELEAMVILGVKGSISEYELSLFRQRSQEAIRAKAQRGALQFTLPGRVGVDPGWPSSGIRIDESNRRSGWSSTNSWSSAAGARC
jgi:hypothetical protein